MDVPLTGIVRLTDNEFVSGLNSAYVVPVLPSLRMLASGLGYARFKSTATVEKAAADDMDGPALSVGLPPIEGLPAGAIDDMAALDDRIRTIPVLLAMFGIDSRAEEGPMLGRIEARMLLELGRPMMTCGLLELGAGTTPLWLLDAGRIVAEVSRLMTIGVELDIACG